jgi:hypothetical protein
MNQFFDGGSLYCDSDLRGSKKKAAPHCFPQERHCHAHASAGIDDADFSVAVA